MLDHLTTGIQLATSGLALTQDVGLTLYLRSHKRSNEILERSYFWQKVILTTSSVAIIVLPLTARYFKPSSKTANLLRRSVVPLQILAAGGRAGMVYNEPPLLSSHALELAMLLLQQFALVKGYKRMAKFSVLGSLTTRTLSSGLLVNMLWKK